MASFEGKVIAITGAASGIALATAKLLSSLGARLSLADVQKEQLKKVVADLDLREESILFRAVDVRKKEQVSAWIEDTVQHFGRLDGAASLAGVISRKNDLLQDLEDDDWEFVMSVNATGMMHCLRAELKVMSGGGSIVNAASIAGLIGRRRNSTYNASKHAVIGVTKSAAKEVGADRKIRVNCVAP